MRGSIRILIAVVLAMATSLSPAISRGALAAGQCFDQFNWHAVAASGYANNVVGTAAWTTSWSSWSVPSGAFSNVAVWIYDDSGHYLEGGFYSGAGSNVPWTNGMLPYYTLNNGTTQFNGAGDYLTANASTWIEAHDWTGPYSTYVHVQSFYLYPGTYTMLTPRHNYFQGETSNTSAWMGGGSGETFSALWEDNGSSWHYWGFHNDCADSPYWINSLGSDSWTIGGY
jgi:hypothetical protein